MKLIFLHGLAGVGKLTVGRELAQLTGYKLFHNHLAVDLVESVFEFGNRPFVELREMIWLTVFSRAAEEQLAGWIFTFTYDRIVRSNFIEETRRAVESGSGSVSFVELRCSPGELERRIEQPSRREFGKLNSVARFRELKEAGVFVVPGIPPGGLVVETDGMSAAETAEEIFMRLGLGPAGLISDGLQRHAGWATACRLGRASLGSGAAGAWLVPIIPPEWHITERRRIPTSRRASAGVSRSKA